MFPNKWRPPGLVARVSGLGTGIGVRATGGRAIWTQQGLCQGVLLKILAELIIITELRYMYE